MKRRLLAWIWLIALLLSACAPEQIEKQEKLRVVSTIFPPYDFAREIGGELISLNMLLPPGIESHAYEPAPKDMQAISQCDVFLYIGGESEAWASKLLSSIDTSAIRVVRLMDSIEEKLMEEEHQEEHMHAHEEALHDEKAAIYDEHIWTSPKNAVLMAEAIERAFVAADAKNQAEYKARAANYIDALHALDQRFAQISESAKTHTLIFGDRFPLRYFADAYGFSYLSAFPGCSVDSEPSAATVAALHSKVKHENIPVVFYLELSNEKMADTLIEGTQAKKLLFHSCHNITKQEFEEGASYLTLMEGNAVRLKEAVS